MSEPDAVDRAPHAQPFRHEAAFYSSAEEFVAIVAPFVALGVADGTPVLVEVQPSLEAVLTEALGGTEGWHRLGVWGADLTHRPFAALQRHHLRLSALQAEQPGAVRMVREPPHPGTGSQWDGWVRYEAAVNDLFTPFDAWTLCPYDTRRTSAAVRRDVECTHPYVVDGDGARTPSPQFTEPWAFIQQLARREVDPLEATPPTASLGDPSARAARRCIAALGATSTLDPRDVEGLVLAVSEIVTNATDYGRHPIGLRAWIAPDRIVVAVSDAGPGPLEPWAGFLPRPRANGGGFGLWLARQLCARTSMVSDPGAFTVRLVAGTPHPPTPLDL